MKIVSLFSSPRQGGNSEAIARRIMDVAAAKGAQTKGFYLHLLNYKGCYACMGCKQGSEKCVIKDDLMPVLDAVADADVTILATPTYFGEMTGQMKCYFDRTLFLHDPGLPHQPHPHQTRAGQKADICSNPGQPQRGPVWRCIPQL